MNTFENSPNMYVACLKIRVVTHDLHFHPWIFSNYDVLVRKVNIYKCLKELNKF